MPEKDAVMWVFVFYISRRVHDTGSCRVFLRFLLKFMTDRGWRVEWDGRNDRSIPFDSVREQPQRGDRLRAESEEEPPDLFSDGDDMHPGNGQAGVTDDKDDSASDESDSDESDSDESYISPPPMGYLEFVPQPRPLAAFQPPGRPGPESRMVPCNPPNMQQGGDSRGHGTGRRVRRRIEIEVGIDVEVRHPDGASLIVK